MATEGEVLSRPFLGIVAAEPKWGAVYAEQLPLEAADEVAAKSTPHDDVAA